MFIYKKQDILYFSRNVDNLTINIVDEYKKLYNLNINSDNDIQLLINNMHDIYIIDKQYDKNYVCSVFKKLLIYCGMDIYKYEKYIYTIILFKFVAMNFLLMIDFPAFLVIILNKLDELKIDFNSFNMIKYLFLSYLKDHYINNDMIKKIYNGYNCEKISLLHCCKHYIKINYEKKYIITDINILSCNYLYNKNKKIISKNMIYNVYKNHIFNKNIKNLSTSIKHKLKLNKLVYKLYKNHIFNKNIKNLSTSIKHKLKLNKLVYKLYKNYINHYSRENIGFGSYGYVVTPSISKFIKYNNNDVMVSKIIENDKDNKIEFDISLKLKNIDIDQNYFIYHTRKEIFNHNEISKYLKYCNYYNEFKKCKEYIVYTSLKCDLTFNTFINTYNNMNTKHLLKILLNLLRGGLKMITNCIYHYDIKSSNILVDIKNNVHYFKYIDFGIQTPLTYELFIENIVQCEQIYYYPPEIFLQFIDISDIAYEIENSMLLKLYDINDFILLNFKINYDKLFKDNYGYMSEKVMLFMISNIFKKFKGYTNDKQFKDIIDKMSNLDYTKRETILYWINLIKNK